MKFAGKWKTLENIMLRKTTQAEKDVLSYVFLYYWKLSLNLQTINIALIPHNKA